MCVGFIHFHHLDSLVGVLGLDVGPWGAAGGGGCCVVGCGLAWGGQGLTLGQAAAAPYPPLYVPLVLRVDRCFL